jgi:hypothetical protein
VVNLATSAGAAATTTIGGGANGTVTITADAAGSAGNAKTVAVALGVGLNQPLAAAINAGAITVTLATDGAGAPDDAANTATLVAAAVENLAGVSAVASGNGTTALTQAVVQKNFTGGGVGFAITSTGDTIKATIAGTPAAAALVGAADAPANDGSGVVTALVATHLTGGGANYAITSTGDTIKASIAGTPTAAALVTAADADGNDGSGVVIAMIATALAGGADEITISVDATANGYILNRPIPSEGATGVISYIGNKRYIRPVLTETGTASGAVCVIARLSKPTYAPV